VSALIYSAIASLDGYVADENGNFDWAAPDEEVHAFVNDLERPVGTHLYGRRMYETMVFWESVPDLAAEPPVMREYAEIWQGADKIVYSKTLTTVASARTRIEREFEPEAIRALKVTAAHDISVGGRATIARTIVTAAATRHQRATQEDRREDAHARTVRKRATCVNRTACCIRPARWRLRRGREVGDDMTRHAA
jgi:dihydrofolate reductase